MGCWKGVVVSISMGRTHAETTQTQPRRAGRELVRRCHFSPDGLFPFFFLLFSWPPAGLRSGRAGRHYLRPLNPSDTPAPVYGYDDLRPEQYPSTPSLPCLSLSSIVTIDIVQMVYKWYCWGVCSEVRNKVKSRILWSYELEYLVITTLQYLDTKFGFVLWSNGWIG